MTQRRHVILFLRRPQLGAVKTRLGRDIGALAALRFYRACCGHVLALAAGDPRWRLWIAATPDRPWPLRRAWPRLARRPIRLLPQGRGDLGRRMARGLAAPPAGPAILVGTDIPDIDAAALRAAFAALGRADAVFGPAEDGGFWLVGLSARARRLAHGRALFSGVRWSGPHALADSRRSLTGRRIASVRMLADIDSGADLATWKAGAGVNSRAAPFFPR